VRNKGTTRERKTEKNSGSAKRRPVPLDIAKTNRASAAGSWIFPGAADADDLRLAGQLSFRADFARVERGGDFTLDAGKVEWKADGEVATAEGTPSGEQPTLTAWSRLSLWSSGRHDEVSPG
jgi:hypothetical protein